MHQFEGVINGSSDLHAFSDERSMKRLASGCPILVFGVRHVLVVGECVLAVPAIRDEGSATTGAEVYTGGLRCPVGEWCWRPMSPVVAEENGLGVAVLECKDRLVARYVGDSRVRIAVFLRRAGRDFGQLAHCSPFGVPPSNSSVSSRISSLVQECGEAALLEAQLGSLQQNLDGIVEAGPFGRRFDENVVIG